MHRPRAIPLAALLAALVIPACTRDIPAREIGDGYVIVGELGKPLGEIVTIEGTTFLSTQKAFAEAMLIDVESIDGVPNRVARSLLLRYPSGANLPTLEEGRRYRFIGYEDGGFIGTPPGALDYTGPVATAPFGFSTQYVIIRVDPLPSP